MGTISILIVLVLRIDLRRSAEAMRDSVGVWLAVAFVTSALMLIVSSHKWGRLLRAVGVRTKKTELLQLYTIGFFASSFLPGSVGGDVLRWHLAGKQVGRRVPVAATIVAERITGAVTLVAVCLFAVFVAVPSFATTPVLILLAAMTGALVAGIVGLLDRRLAEGIMAVARRVRVGRVFRPVYDLLCVTQRLPKRSLGEALGYSVAFYVSAGLSFWMIGMAFGIDITLVQATAAQALISLLTMIPISVGGLGLAQVGDVYLLGILGVPAAEALGISVMRSLISYGYALIGGVLYLRWDGRSRANKQTGALAGLAPAASIALRLDDHHVDRLRRG